MDKKQLVEDIRNKMDLFKKGGSSCGRRQYLSAAASLYEYERRLTEAFNSGDAIDIDIVELEEMHHNVSAILNNLGIT